MDVIGSITSSYNNTYHTSLRRSPASVNSKTRNEVWATQNIVPVLESIERSAKDNTKSIKRKRRKVYKYKRGDHVRVSHLRKSFERAYDNKYSGDIFKIRQRSIRDERPIYKIEDWDGDPIIGNFYQAELEKVIVDPDKAFQIERIIKTRKKKGTKEFFVKWLYYPNKFNSWVKDIGLYKSA